MIRCSGVVRCIVIMIMFSYPIKGAAQHRKGNIMNNDIRFSANFRISDSKLLVNYSVHNRGPVTIYLLNRLFREIPEWDMSPNVVYIQPDTATRTVHLSKKLADIPSGVNVTAPVAPFVTPVRPGETFQEQIAVPLPIEEYTQYGEISGRANSDIETHTEILSYIDFTLSYYLGTEHTTETRREIHGNEVIIPHIPPNERPVVFGELFREPVRMDVPVRLSVKSNR